MHAQPPPPTLILPSTPPQLQFMLVRYALAEENACKLLAPRAIFVLRPLGGGHEMPLLRRGKVGISGVNKRHENEGAPPHICMRFEGVFSFIQPPRILKRSLVDAVVRGFPHRLNLDVD